METEPKTLPVKSTEVGELNDPSGLILYVEDPAMPGHYYNNQWVQANNKDSFVNLEDVQ